MNTTSESLLFRLQHSSEDGVDQNAWEKFVQLYTPLIFYWTRKVGLQQADAADLVQDVLSIVFRRLPDFQYDVSGSFRGWLRTVTLNKFREETRKRVTDVSVASNSMRGIVPMVGLEGAACSNDVGGSRSQVKPLEES